MINLPLIIIKSSDKITLVIYVLIKLSMSLSFNLIIKIFSLILLFSGYPNKHSSISYAKDSIYNKEKSFKNPSIKKETLKSFYILGPGDELYIKFDGIEVFNNKYSINHDGYLYLPEVDEIKAQGKTISELTNYLEEIYQEYIENPNLKILITKYRPVTIFLGGAVQRTGIYTLNYSSNNTNAMSFELGSEISSEFEGNKKGMVVNSGVPPKLIDAIKLGVGITSNADISDIKVIRKNSISQGGGNIKTTISLLKILEEGDLSQNIDLRDGDYIYVSESNLSTIEQLTMVNKSNLTPDLLNIYVNGNVSSPGRITLPQGTSLYEAIAASGGKQSNTGRINFLRLKNNSAPEKRILRYQPGSPKGSQKNPILQENDIIIVQKNALGKTTEIITDFTAPIISGIGLYSILN